MIEMIRWQEIVTNSIINYPENKNSIVEIYDFWKKIMTNMVEIVCLDLNLL